MFGPGCCWSLIVISEGSGSRRGTMSPRRLVTAKKGTKNCAARAKLFFVLIKPVCIALLEDVSIDNEYEF